MKQYRCDHCGVIVYKPMKYDIQDSECGRLVRGTGEPIILCDEHKKKLGDWLMAYRNSLVDSPDKKKEFNWNLF